MSIQCADSQALLAVSLRAYFRQALADCRQLTLDLVADIQPELLKRQAHPDFSPVGWHLGHIAYTESLWAAQQGAGQPSEFSRYLLLFAADGLPKAKRENLPDLLEILTYLGEVRSQTLQALSIADLPAQAPIWHWLLQHESQHAETIAMVLALHRLGERIPGPSPQKQKSPVSDMVYVSGGESVQGSNLPAAIDNERPAHSVSLAGYWIDRTPVTCGQYRHFVEAGGYQQAQWWTPEGWHWQQSAQVKAPLYWNNSDFDQHPVCGVSWYEADAYARFVGKRLPTEAEWAKAAGWDAIASQSRLYPWGDSLRDECNYGQQVGATTPVGQFAHTSLYGCKDMLGNIWEWTDSWFAGYPGFNPFPYAGYSQVYFDQAHRVLRGGSWATPQWALRNSFRNWYHPHRREAFAGFRCAAKKPPC